MPLSTLRALLGANRAVANEERKDPVSAANLTLTINIGCHDQRENQGTFQINNAGMNVTNTAPARVVGRENQNPIYTDGLSVHMESLHPGLEALLQHLGIVPKAGQNTQGGLSQAEGGDGGVRSGCDRKRSRDREDDEQTLLLGETSPTPRPAFQRLRRISTEALAALDSPGESRAS